MKRLLRRIANRSLFQKKLRPSPFILDDYAPTCVVIASGSLVPSIRPCIWHKWSRTIGWKRFWTSSDISQKILVFATRAIVTLIERYIRCFLVWRKNKKFFSLTNYELNLQAHVSPTNIQPKPQKQHRQLMVSKCSARDCKETSKHNVKRRWLTKIKVCLQNQVSDIFLHV